MKTSADKTDDTNPCGSAKHDYYRIGKTNLMRCRRCDKTIYKNFEKDGQDK